MLPLIAVFDSSRAAGINDFLNLSDLQRKRIKRELKPLTCACSTPCIGWSLLFLIFSNFLNIPHCTSFSHRSNCKPTIEEAFLIILFIF
ncbi:hypothetical protein GDO81_028421 [Engystomops pustulosus]|uniref:Uncharacterized protein n=1 Tax=Engystomops pustulosus TaxID=76066 RepID=A0AAV6YL76_ENGPU|nr:hypothetical protein GDO81_028421 [Engystomops pustulosus]